MIGTSLKRYEILEELGQGGMSVVYRGRDTTLDRDVAVKVLHEHLANKEENRKRFRREAQAIARLEHDHILDVYDYSGEEDDRSFIVMEYIPGMDLRAFVDTHGTPPPEVAAMIGTVVADALAHAHEHGVIHRDLKPENVMVSEDGTLKLMDFGIAHVADAETMTQTGSLLGSPAHMAPEIIDGQDVNRRSDIFSYGTVLYWLSTGEFPFQGDNAPHLLRQVLDCNFDDPESVEPRMPRELSRIICRCLSRQPADRYETVADLRTDLLNSLELLDEIDISDDLESYFNDPEGYTESFEAAIVDRLIERGRAAMERDDVPEAISHFNRVLGYEPDNETVQRELEELDEKEIEPAQIAIAAGILLAAASAVIWVTLSPHAGPKGAVPAAESAVASSLERAARHQATQALRPAARRNAARIRDRAGRVAAGVAARGTARSTHRRGREVASGVSAQTVTSAAPPSGASTESSSGDGGSAGSAVARDPESGRPRPPEGAPDTGTTPTATRDTGVSKSPETFTYKFKVLPLAANVYIDGTRMSVPEVVDGVSLEKGLHRIRVVSAGCKPYETKFRVDGPSDSKMSIVLEWKPASVRVISNRPAVVYLDGDKSRPYQIGANGKNARISVPFGEADSDRRETHREISLEVRAGNDLQKVRRQTVTLRPGQQRSINVNFPRSGR